MLRATMTSPGKVEFDSAPKPTIGDKDVLLRIRRIGICGSGIHVYHGRHPHTPYPVVQGYEFCGEAAKGWSRCRIRACGWPGYCSPQIVCGECLPCREAWYHLCEKLKVIGFQALGVAREFFVFPESGLLKLPPGFTPELGALVEPTAVAVHAVGRAGGVAGLRVLVLGIGPIGSLVALVAQWRGAAQILISDLSERRLGIARQCGIVNTFNPQKAFLESYVSEVFDPDRTDTAFECVGVTETASQAIRCVRKGGATIVVGFFSNRPEVASRLMQDRELDVRGTLMYRREDYIDAIRFLFVGGIISKPLLTKNFSFRNYPESYLFIEANREKGMIELGE